jgi:hypothetical protein
MINYPKACVMTRKIQTVMAIKMTTTNLAGLVNAILAVRKAAANVAVELKNQKHCWRSPSNGN